MALAAASGTSLTDLPRHAQVASCVLRVVDLVLGLYLSD